MTNLPIGFTENVVDLEAQLDEGENSLELMQILSKMYHIAVQFYIDHDVRKARFYQKKLNQINLRSLSAVSCEKFDRKSQCVRRMTSEMYNHHLRSSSYVQTIVQNSERVKLKLSTSVEEDIEKQQQQLKNRLLKRVKSRERI